jgi:hypothetical protein
MPQTLSLRVIQGADRGLLFRNLSVPITIGREEGNSIQLSDERVSRFHVKIQEDDGRLVVTDLDSTNGTRINGHACNLKILRIGDTIALGRSVLLVSSSQPSAPGAGSDQSEGVDASADSWHTVPPGDSLQCHTSCPELPRGMSPGQAAELRELLDHVHAGLRSIVDGGVMDDTRRVVEIPQEMWSKLLQVQSEVAVWIRAIEDPQTSQS